jgi:hypothetical protein
MAQMLSGQLTTRAVGSPVPGQRQLPFHLRVMTHPSELVLELDRFDRDALHRNDPATRVRIDYLGDLSARNTLCSSGLSLRTLAVVAARRALPANRADKQCGERLRPPTYVHALRWAQSL